MPELFSWRLISPEKRLQQNLRRSDSTHFTDATAIYIVPLHFLCTLLFFVGNVSFKSQVKILLKILTNPDITRCPVGYVVHYNILYLKQSGGSMNTKKFYLITVSHSTTHTQLNVWVFYLLLSDLASQYVNEGGSSGQAQWGRCISYMARLWAVIC